MIKNWFKKSGPGTLVAAAFIGPGTVTLCTLAVSIVATIVLQEMASRLGIISQKGLSEVIRSEIKHPIINKLILLLILSAIVVGNASYEAGNISGGILGLETITGELRIVLGNYSLNILSFVVGIIAFILLYIGNYKFLERVLVMLVIIMSISFLITAFLTKPSISSILKGALVPSFPDGSLLTAL